ncbi:nicotinate-nucleotide adenylyltransferase [soil metagenome]
MSVRWGVLGGTFDPIHYAHLAIAEQVREQFDLGGVLFVPANETVHKDAAAVTPVGHRLTMLELAVAGNGAFKVDRLEIDRGGPSYTVDTLTELAARQPEVAWTFIVSAQAARELPGWREPQRIVELATIVIVPRLGYTTPDREWLAQRFPGHGDHFVFADAPALGHSASDIRSRVAAGHSIRYLVPDAVATYIGQHGLYRAR